MTAHPESETKVLQRYSDDCNETGTRHVISLERCEVHCNYWEDSQGNVAHVKCGKLATIWYVEISMIDGREECVFGRCAKHHLDNMTPEYRKISYEDAIIWDVHQS